MNRRELLVGTAIRACRWNAHRPGLRAVQADASDRVRGAWRAGSGNDVFARALITIIDQEKLSPVRMQVANKPGGGSTAAAAYVVSKKGDPHVIACFTNIWLTDTLVQEAATNKLQRHDARSRASWSSRRWSWCKADSPYQDAGGFHRRRARRSRARSRCRAARSPRARTSCASCS